MHLITGGLGFIGNELARQLSKTEEVAILDNRNRTAPRIEDLKDIPVHPVDLTDHTAVAAAIAKLRPKVVFHLAAVHFIPECNDNPERTLRVNVEATQGLLRACEGAGVEHLVFASSGAVYADSAAPLTENSPVAPVDIYAWSKWFGEELCRWHAAQWGLPVTICRIFNNYGPRETNLHILPEIIKQLRLGDELLLGNTTTRRDYIYTSDTARALILLSKQTPKPVETVNVSSGHHSSVDELIAQIGEILGRRLVVVTDPKRFRKADKQVQVADIAKMKTLTGWAPEINLARGLEEMLRFDGLLG